MSSHQRNRMDGFHAPENIDANAGATVLAGLGEDCAVKKGPPFLTALEACTSWEGRRSVSRRGKAVKMTPHRRNLKMSAIPMPPLAPRDQSMLPCHRDLHMGWRHRQARPIPRYLVEQIAGSAPVVQAVSHVAAAEASRRADRVA